MRSLRKRREAASISSIIAGVKDFTQDLSFGKSAPVQHNGPSINVAWSISRLSLQCDNTFGRKYCPSV
jgi:hypothetical protein